MNACREQAHRLSVVQVFCTTKFCFLVQCMHAAALHACCMPFVHSDLVQIQGGLQTQHAHARLQPRTAHGNNWGERQGLWKDRLAHAWIVRWQAGAAPAAPGSVCTSRMVNESWRPQPLPSGVVVLH